jgi:hypothetical protein
VTTKFLKLEANKQKDVEERDKNPPIRKKELDAGRVNPILQRFQYQLKYTP